MHVPRYLPGVAVILVALAACQDVDPTTVAGPPALKAPSRSLMVSETGVFVSPALAEFNSALSAAGVQNVRIESAEISVAYASEEWTGATTLIASDRTHTLGSAFVPADPRRGGRTSITYVVDQSDGNALRRNPANPTQILQLTNVQTEPELDASMAFWGTQPTCNPPVVIKEADTGADPDVVDGLVLGNPALIGTNFADITHAGWLPRAFFDRLAPNGSAFILGVTFTFVFVDAEGSLTDNDGDGRADVAFREIYYNSRFPWSWDASSVNVDIQSVGIHESGHAYGLGHFGKIFQDARGNLHYAPQAIMNAVYVAPFREITGSDIASFCMLWASPT